MDDNFFNNNFKELFKGAIFDFFFALRPNLGLCVYKFK